MDADDLPLADAALPEVPVDLDRALHATVARGRARRRRHRVLAGVGAAAAVLGLAAVAGAVADRDAGDGRTKVAAGPDGPAATAPTEVPEAHPCAAEPGSATDVAGEPDWRRWADYRDWTDRAGCLVRIDVLAERPGPDHCGWQDADILITGPVLGEAYTDAANDRQYVRDPSGVFGDPALAAGFDPTAELPTSARDTGFRRGDAALWVDPDRATAVWLVHPDHVERWPAGEPPICA